MLPGTGASKQQIKSILVEEPHDFDSKIPSLLKLGLESDIQSHMDRFCPKACRQILKMFSDSVRSSTKS